MSPKPTLRHRFEYALFMSVDLPLRLLPWKAVLALGHGLGRFFHFVDARHRRVVRENLRACDLNLDEAQVKAMSKECYAHFGGMALGLLHLRHASAEELDRLVTIEGLENFDAAQAMGRGFIQLSGHYGNWEAMALAQSAKGRCVCAIGRDMDNPYLREKLRALRTRFGNWHISKDGAVRETVKALKAGRGVGFVLDQDALGMGLFVRFLGRWASTFATAGTLAVKYRVPILPVFSWPEPDGRIRVRFDPPFEVPFTGDTDRDVWNATQLMSQKIEEQIRREPRYWFWMHRRFKTQPGQPGALPQQMPKPEWLETPTET